MNSLNCPRCSWPASGNGCEHCRGLTAPDTPRPMGEVIAALDALTPGCPVCHGRLWDPGHGDCPECQKQTPTVADVQAARIELERSIRQLCRNFEAYSGFKVVEVDLVHGTEVGSLGFFLVETRVRAEL